ncbi:GntR family transcriptional regulator [Ochrobactrum oryzae]|nr:GntR family transcriptional regulator [Brucella oryzae]
MKQEKRLVGVMNDRNRPKVEDADDAYDHLFSAIVDQRLLPGTKLTEMALVEAFGVGRRAVATALQRLTWEKLVVFFPKRGAFVAAPDADEAREVFAARVAIEAGTTEAVARAADPRQLPACRRISTRKTSCGNRATYGKRSTCQAGFMFSWLSFREIGSSPNRFASWSPAPASSSTCSTIRAVWPDGTIITTTSSVTVRMVTWKMPSS